MGAPVGREEASVDGLQSLQSSELDVQFGLYSQMLFNYTVNPKTQVLTTSMRTQSRIGNISPNDMRQLSQITQAPFSQGVKSPLWLWG